MALALAQLLGWVIAGAALIAVVSGFLIVVWLERRSV
jgi:hypothetical protein